MDELRPSQSGQVMRCLLPLILTLIVLLPGCGSRHIGTTAGSYMRHARQSGDPNIRYLAYMKLADPNCYVQDGQKAEAVQLLSDAMETREQSVAIRATICKTLGEIGLPEARPVLLKSIRDADPIIRAEACRALGKVGLPEDATNLTQVMTTDMSRDCRVAAIEAIGRLGANDPRIDLKLVEGMQNPDPAIRAASYESLCAVTGEDLGLDYKSWHQFAQNRLSQDATFNPENGTEVASQPEQEPSDSQIQQVNVPATVP